MPLQQTEHKTMDGFVVALSPLGTGGISVIIPVFNEARTLSEIINRVLARPEVGQVIVVDDGSTDATGQLLADKRSASPRVTHLRHSSNQGKGSAIRTGLAHATCPWVLIQDADLEYDPADYPTLSAAIQGIQHPVAVYGSRFFSPRSAGPSKSPWVGLHRLGNRLLTGLSNLLLGQRLTDEATCLKLIPLEILRRMELQEDGFGFCPEVTSKLSRLGIRIIEVPVSYSGRSKAEGKKIRLRHGIEAIQCLLRYRSWKPQQLGKVKQPSPSMHPPPQ